LQDRNQPGGVVGADDVAGQQPYASPVGVIADEPDQAEVFSSSHAVAQDRGLPAGRPRGAHHRDQAEAGLVGAADPGSAGAGGSTIWAQVCLRHSVMACSSRSTARRAGCWTVNPIWCSRVHTADG
jgi:hypothetical protein